MAKFNETDQAFLFKETYSDLSRNHYNADHVLLSQVRKRYDLQGLKDHVAVPLGFQGGFGGSNSGTTVPEFVGESGDQVEIVAKDVYGRAKITRRAMKSSLTDKGAFVRATQRPVQKCLERYNFGANGLLYGDATGRIFPGAKTLASSAWISGTAASGVVGLIAADFAKYKDHIVVNDLIEFGNAADTAVESGLFKITAIDETNSRLTISRVSGAFDPANSTDADDKFLYIQGMFKDAPQGLAGAMAQSGTAYGITIGTNWLAYQYDASSAPFSVPMLNKVFMTQQKRVGNASSGRTNIIVVHPDVFATILDLDEGKKRYSLSPRDPKAAKAGFGFTGVTYDAPGGKEMGIMSDIHCPRTTAYLLQTDFVTCHHLPDHGWHDEDGRVFLREADSPSYEARYGGSYETVIHPTFQAEIINLGV